MKNQAIWLNRCVMVEPRSFELLSLQTGKQPIFKNIKHAVRNSERGIIPIHGILTKKSEVFDDVLGMTSYEKISEEIEEALIDKEVETIILDIDSPGGEVNGLFDLSDFIYQARRKKRIVAIANDDAYSAAYAIASSAEKVLVTRTSGVGSIGVIASHIDQSGFDEKQGIKYTTVFAGSRKNDLNPHEPITSESLESLKSEVNRLYGMLVELIACNRNLSVEAIKSTEAGLYFGEKAVEIGLADGITILSEFKSINKKGDITMNEKTTNDLETDNLTKYRTEVLELIRLCNLSRMPEKIGEFIEQSVSVEQAREVLMELLAERTKKTEILKDMISITEGNNLGDLLKYEVSNLYSRDQITVAKGQNLKLGKVVGYDTKDGFIKALNPTATDGTQTAIGVIASDVNAKENSKGVIIARGAILADHAVVWPANIIEEQKTAAIKHLEGRGIIIRKGA